ncbi:MAG TPA: CopD family protein, partial [Anaerolineae bacterium]|jgi:copper transport protein
MAALIRLHAEGKPFILVPAVFLLLTQSLLSHSAAEAQWIAPVLADWIHFAFAALWLGGVAALAMVIMSIPYNERARLKDLGLAISRFSPLAMLSVVVIGFSGIAQSAGFVGSTDALLSTAYGRVLLAKAGLLIILVGFGVFHQQVISPRLQDWRLRNLPDGVAASRQFHRSIMAEGAVALLLLLAVALLIGLPPGRDFTAVTSTPAVINSRASTDGALHLTLGVSPAKPGFNTFDLLVQSGHNEPVVATEKVILRIKHDGVDTGESEVILEPRGNGHYAAYTGSLSLSGSWQITTIVRQPLKADDIAVFQVDLQP